VRVVVTGGAGFIGGNLCRRLLDRGHAAVVVDDLSTGHAANVPAADLRVGSILDDAVLDTAFGAGVDSVVHLAAIGSVPKSVDDPHRTNEVNITGTLRVLEAARRHGVGHVVVASSAAVYGPTPPLPAHELVAVRPVSPYAVSKVATEQLALAWQATYDLGTLALRFFNVFGPLQGVDHDYAAVVPAFVDAALAGRPIPIHGTGEQTRDFVDVGTVAAVLVDAVERRVVHDHPVNLAIGDRRSLLDVVAELEAILGRPLARAHQPTRAGDVPDSQADIGRLRQLFGDLEPVPFADALRATVDWTAGR
jgi:UDP-glucose 4-epimerase